MQTVIKGDTIRVHYHGKLESGETFDSSFEDEPLEFEVGGGFVIEGFDNGVIGMGVGDKKEIFIPSENAYGTVSDEMIFELPIENFPENLTPEIGMVLNMTNQEDETIQVTVIDIREDHVLIDANHPLAGKNLIFELELMEIKKKSLILMP